MILYRAINKTDEYLLEKIGRIPCSYLNQNEKELIKYKDLDEEKRDTLLENNYNALYEQYILQERGYAIDTIVGHVNGKTLNSTKTPWISTTSDCRFAISEYAVPQSGKYNKSGSRKPVIVIEKENIYKDVKDVKKLRLSKEKDFGIDLRNDNISILYEKGAIDPTNNRKLPGIKGFSTKASEVLIYKEISKKDIKLIIYPFIQDIIYSCNIDMDKCYNLFISNEEKLKILYNDLCDNLGNYKKIFKELYPTYETGNNLTDLLIKYNDCLPNDTIENKYEYVKHIKRRILEITIQEFNKRFNSKLKLNKIVDEKILVKNTNRISIKENKDINDIILVEQNGELYKFNPSTSEYISHNNKTISKQKVKELTQRKKK